MKRRRLFYVPGFISLLGLPILLLIWGPEDPIRPTAMRLYLPSEEKSSPGVLRFNREGVLQALKHKKIESLEFDYLPSRLHPEYNYYRRSAFLLNEMAQQQFLHDTTAVLKVHFDEFDNDYGDVVWMLNNAILFDYKRYVYMDDDLYLFANPPPRPSTEKIEPLYLGNDVLIATKSWTPPTSWELLWRRLSWKWEGFAYGARRYYWFCIGFLLLIVLPGVLYIKRTRRPAGS